MRRRHTATILFTLSLVCLATAMADSTRPIEMARRAGSASRLLPPPASAEDFAGATPAKVDLGSALFFDKILSGNRNVACATCHHPLSHTSDGLSLPLGVGGRGLSVTRATGDQTDGVLERVPRNSPAIFNLGAVEFTVMFHDGRVRQDTAQPGGFLSPAGSDLPDGLDNALAVQAMFPVTSATEMAG
ncbi:MAG: cytochrome-c peroxidase, partial [Acidobacteriota bacterium]|nr:cytochrome-c peroxidase [Acidobacteriota bacterium]